MYIYIYSHHTDFPLLNTIEAMHWCLFFEAEIEQSYLETSKACRLGNLYNKEVDGCS